MAKPPHLSEALGITDNEASYSIYDSRLIELCALDNINIADCNIRRIDIQTLYHCQQREGTAGGFIAPYSVEELTRLPLTEFMRSMKNPRGAPMIVIPSEYLGINCLIDGHHRAYAAWNRGLPYVYAHVVQDPFWLDLLDEVIKKALRGEPTYDGAYFDPMA